MCLDKKKVRTILTVYLPISKQVMPAPLPSSLPKSSPGKEHTVNWK